MSARVKAAEIAGLRSENHHPRSDLLLGAASAAFGSHVFSPSVMKEILPAKVCANVFRAMEGLEKIRPEFADAIAVAMKEWAMGLGATHYTHWFQPLTGAAAEKHDSFMEWQTDDSVIENFSGKALLQGEPDASSFPSGGLRTTFEARGYTGWDPSSPAFVWSAGDGVTLFIPSVFFSWTGEILDTKIPLHRSSARIEKAVLRLLKLCGIETNHVHSTVGAEQEYFIVDRALRNLRPDLVMAGRTVFGAPPPKGQELQDHYFGSVKDRILRFMRDFEASAIRLGIPVKTRHNEVAPAQHEITPIFERAAPAVDHNIILMELMRQIAIKHELSCLLHEKPFAGLNGSGKHINWALSTDRGLNLLDPSLKGNNLPFLTLLTAILHAVWRHPTLLRASIGSVDNDFRLGGHEAPPPVMSVYLGAELEGVLRDIEKGFGQIKPAAKGKYDLGIPVIPELPRDNTDRNRTSPFAFTGNKFEFRAAGSSASVAGPVTVLNLIVAESLEAMLDEVEKSVGQGAKKLSSKKQAELFLPVLKKYLSRSRHIRFSGDNYSDGWLKEVAKRKLPNISDSLEAFEAYKAPSTKKVFDGILGSAELKSRYEISVEQYALKLNIEARLMTDIFLTQALPAALRYQERVAKSILAKKQVIKGKVGVQEKLLKELSENIDEAMTLCDELKKRREAAAKLPMSRQAKAYRDRVAPLGEKLRCAVDHLESLVDDTLWPLPKYREMLFLV